jgi:hypothetical protein
MEGSQLHVLDLESETMYVPEPAPIALLCAGIAGLALLQRRRTE